jgi:APA family basic amino acid/polyamine antiporter
VPLGGVLSSAVLMCTAPPSTLLRLFIWMALGLALYAFYGRFHSKLRQVARAAKS